MTACVNRKHTKKVAAVVTASLVGALSLGAAPVAAMADTGPGIDLQVASAADTFSRGEITLSGSVTRDSHNVYSATANANGTALTVNVDSVTPLGTYAADADEYETAIYKADENGDKTASAISAIVEPGKYVVEAVAKASSQYSGGFVTAVINVKGASLENLTPYEVNPADTTDANDSSFTYTGSALEIGFQANHVPYEEGVDYSVKILNKGTDEVDTAPGVDVIEAGDYVAYVTGLGQYAGQDLEIPFTVTEFSFAHATIEVDDVIGSDSAPTHPTKDYVGSGDTYAEPDPSLVNLTFSSSVSGSGLFKDNGEYTFIASVDKTNKNIVNNADKAVTVNIVAKSATFQVNKADVEDSYLIDLSEDDAFITSANKFNWDVIDVFNGNTELVKGANYTVTVSKGGRTGFYNDLEDLVPGTYEVTVKVDPSTTSYQAGGSATFTVQVVEGVIDVDANAVVYLNSSSQDIVLDSYTKNYDGKAVYKTDFIVKLFDENNKQLTDSSLDWKLLDSNGNDVSTTGALRAGAYRLVISSTNYLLNGTTEIPVTINKVDLSSIKVGALQDWYGASYLPIDPSDSNGYTWEEFDLRYDTHEADSDDDDLYDDGEGWDRLSTLPDSIQSDTYLQCQYWDEDAEDWVEVDWGERAVKEGDYRIVLTGNRDLALNFDFANDDYSTVVEFKAVNMNKLVFNDVNPDDWFFDVVFRAQDNDWMNGYADSSIFGAEDSITRGQVACVLYNMASSAGKADETNLSYNELVGWKSFDDVDGKAYYGKAIAWAKQAGVVNGYADGTFNADAPVTREELDAMLANYAARIDQVDTSVADADGVLSDMPDAGSVSDWATEVVARAVDNSIMGNSGVINPSADITRAEVAGMICNYADLD